MKNLMSFKLGKEKIEIWQVFIFIFLLLMFIVCIFLGIGFLSSAHSNVEVNETVINDELGIIADFNRINNDNYSEKQINEFKKNYKKYISDNAGLLKQDNMEFDIYRNIGSSIYRININKNKWFLFNNINKNSTELNELFVVDTDLKFHKIYYQTNTIVKDCTEDPNYENYKVGDFNFFYNKKNDYFYGYKSISDDYDSYFVISGEKLGINASDYEKFFKLIDNNINISTNKTYKTVGLLLSDDKRKITINDSTSLDLVTNVNIISLRNGIKGNSNVINYIDSKSLDTFSIKEIFKNIDDYSTSSKKNGYLQYKYKNTKIYLKYNLKDYPDFNFSEGGINGALIECNDNTLLVQFDKVYTFASQEELEKVLESTIGSIIN